MPRKIPASHKKRRTKLLRKRAIKRGDVDPEASTGPKKTKANRPRPGRQRIKTDQELEGIASARKLQSSFVKLSPEFLATTKQLAATLTLRRPIPIERAVFPKPGSGSTDAASTSEARTITIPGRPKWTYDMSKAMLEQAEDELFEKWLNDTEIACGARDPVSSVPVETVDHPGHNLNPDSEVADDVMPSAAPLFERNLEVWRQLWRVVEISQIVLILLDSRCPLLHYPPSLHNYLATFNPPRKIIFVLTKVDIIGPERSKLWSRYLSENYPGVRVVQVESYAERPSGDGQGKRKLLDPHIPLDLRRNLVEALKAAHEELLSSQAIIHQSVEHVKENKAKVIDAINWEAVIDDKGEDTPAETVEDEITSQDARHDEDEVDTIGSSYLTVGLIGQPNVGKSSLLNALLGERRVKTSRTPGKTKHFQTLFWTPQIRLVDCPGLVFPAPKDPITMELQVVAGVLPIAHVPSIPACIHTAARLLPLERVFSLEHPSLSEPVEEDKRTWRDGRKRERPPKKLEWTTTTTLSAYAEAKGWMTAMVGRPDMNRAGNAILQLLAEGTIQWGFYPPDTDMSTTELGKQGAYDGQGIWIQPDIAYDIHQPERSHVDRHHDEEDDVSDDEDYDSSEGGSEETDEMDGDSEDESEGEYEEGEDDEGDEDDVDNAGIDSNKTREPETRGQFQSGMFAALALEDKNGQKNNNGDE